MEIKDLKIGLQVEVKWLNSYSVTKPGWQDIRHYSANKCEVTSSGFLVIVNYDVIALAQNYSKDTESVLVDRIKVIPKVCITSISIVSSSSCLWTT